MLVLLVFILAGAVLANFFPALKFAVFALAVSVIYLVYLLGSRAGLAPALLQAGGGFVGIQIGYLCGLALRTVYGQPLPGRIFWYSEIRKEKDHLK